MKKSGISILFLLFGLFYSCSTDFEVNEEFEDVTLVYGLLNYKDSVNYIKVNHTFVSESDAYVQAADSGSTDYPIANVSIEEWVNGSAIKTISFQQSQNKFEKDPGIFYNGNNILYESNASLNPDAEYRLNIFIPQYGKYVTSSTKLVGDMQLISTLAMDNYKANLRNDLTVQWYALDNAKIYEITIRFYYYDEYTDGRPDNVVLNYVDWVQSPVIGSSTSSSSSSVTRDKLSLEIPSESFFTYLGTVLKEEPNVNRWAKSIKYKPINTNEQMDFSTGCLDFYFNSGGEELYTYIQVNKPSDGIVQEKPAYSNINNGIGVFSTRSQKTIKGVKIKEFCLDSLSVGRFTKHLHFADLAGKFH